MTTRFVCFGTAQLAAAVGAAPGAADAVASVAADAPEATTDAWAAQRRRFGRDGGLTGRPVLQLVRTWARATLGQF